MEEDTSLAEISITLNLPKRRKILFIILGTLITLFGVLALSLVLYTWDRGQIINGVVLEIPLGRLSLEEAQWKLNQLSNDLYKRPVHFISDDKGFLINMKELGFTYSYHEPLQQAYLIGREGTIFNKAISKYKANWGINIKPDYQWNDLVLTEALKKHLSTLNIPAEDAHFFINSNNSMEIVPEKFGRQVDLDSLIASIKMQPLNDSRIILVPFNTVKPNHNKNRS